jgi:hypothetical protein
VAYKVFEKKNTRIGSPILTITKLGRISLNASATKLLRDNTVEYVLVMWDEDALQMALKPTSSKRDTRAYKITFGANNSGAAFSAKSFLDFVGWDLSVKRQVPAEWNEDSNLLEAKVKAAFLKNPKQPKFAPVEAPRRIATQ